MKIIWTEPAVDDIENIKLYISKDSEQYAIAFIERIIESIEKLGKHPKMGRVVPEENDESLREIIIGNFRIMYQIDKDAVLIMTIIHGSMDFKGIKNL